jgi:lia operon protein LiaF
MKNQGLVLLGGLLILVGLISLADLLFHIDLHGSVWAILLIALGLWILFRPRISTNSTDSYHIFGDVIRSGQWKAENETHWMFIGDVRLDLTNAGLPEGETVIRSFSLIGDMKVIAPKDCPLSVSATGLICDLNLFGKKEDVFFSSREMHLPAYEGAAKRIRLESTAVIGGMKVKAAG